MTSPLPDDYPSDADLDVAAKLVERASKAADRSASSMGTNERTILVLDTAWKIRHARLCRTDTVRAMQERDS